MTSAPGTKLLALSQGFRGEMIRPVISLRYRATLVAVALAMVALPLLYVGLAVALAWGVLRVDILLLDSGLTDRVLLFGLASTTGAGGVAVFFMFKPLFAPRGPQPDLHVVSAEEEPTLFGFVGRLCDVIGAPAPSRIVLDCNVNASAAFTRGLRSFIGSELTLTIGLPLVAGLTLRQLTGVLAHEFGHFSQGAAMRLTYVIRSISQWFARVVYERDGWDGALERHARSGGMWIFVIVQIARGTVWLTRRILWVLMWCGHAISALALRQMEYDADRYETQIAGSATFESTSARMRELGWASKAAIAQLRDTWADRRLVDDLPALITSRAGMIPPETRTALHAQALGVRTRALDTHPADGDRVAAVLALDVPGIFTLDAPAFVLFAEFGAVCRSLTAGHYQQMIGDHVSGGVTIEPLDEYLAGESVEADAWDAFRHVCGNVLMTSRLHVLGPIDVDTPGLPSTLMAMRARVIEMEDLAPRMKDASVRLSEIEARLFEMHGDLARAEVRGTGDRRTLSTMRELEQAQTDAAGISAEISEASGPVESYLRLAGARIAAAIGWSSDGSDVAVRPAALDSSELPDLTDAYNVLVQYRPDVEDLRRRFAQLRGLVQPLAEDAQNNQDLVPAMLEATRDLAATLQRLQNLLRPARYPFRRAGSVKSLGVSIIETVPDAEDIAGVLNAATHALQMADKTHMRLVAHLCRTVRQVESELLARSLAVDN